MNIKMNKLWLNYNMEILNIILPLELKVKIIFSDEKSENYIF